MILGFSRVDIEYLESENEAVHKFIAYLASHADLLGNRCALGFYLQEEMEQMATEYIDIYPTTNDQADQLYDWIKALSWPKTGYLAFVFNW